MLFRSVIAGGELYIKSSYTFGPQSDWHIKIKIHLAIPNNMHVISVKHFHKKAINDLLQRTQIVYQR